MELTDVEIDEASAKMREGGPMGPHDADPDFPDRPSSSRSESRRAAEPARGVAGRRSGTAPRDRSSGFLKAGWYDPPVQTPVTLPELIADTEQEILRLVSDRDVAHRRALRDVPLPPRPGRQRLVRQADAARCSGCSPTPRSPATTGPRCPAPRPWSWATTSAWSTTTSRTATRERRHRPTLWALHGIPQAINAGDMLFTLSRKALHRLTDLGFSDAKVLRLMRLHDDTCLALCEGQYLDIWASERAEPMSVELYFDMIGRKTAALIAASVEAGAVLATDDEAVIARYRAFGWALGIAFQLNDDLLGIWGEQATTGKEPTDVARHKMTLPVIYAFEHAGAGRPRRPRGDLADRDGPTTTRSPRRSR